ncbi:hypothetical protein RYX36_022616 [Vicia faba]
MCQCLRQKGVNLLSLTIVYRGRLSFAQDFAKSIVSHLRQKETEIMCQCLRQKGVNLLSLTIVYRGRLSFAQDFAKSIVSQLRQKETVRKTKLVIVIVAYNSNIHSVNC